jgi:DNA-binding NtrC family response regulator
MHVLVLDNNHINGLSQALQLSSHGFTVETVIDIEEARCRLSSMAFDAVVYNVPPWDQAGMERIHALQSAYSETLFYASDKIDEFLKCVRQGRSA